MRPFLAALGVLILLQPASRAQDRPYSVSLFGTFTSSSKLFHHPDDPDQIIRSQFLPLDDIFSAGIDIRRSIENLRIRIGLSAEYISTSDLISVPLSPSGSIPVEDGFTAVPVELSGYFMIPFGDESIQFYMGGGGGLYFGARKYRFGDAEAATVARSTGAGIHVLSGVEYAIKPSLSLRSEIKFRDVQFETTNRFERSSTTYLGRTILLDQSPLPSRVNIDGLTVHLGIVFHF